MCSGQIGYSSSSVLEATFPLDRTGLKGPAVSARFLASEVTRTRIMINRIAIPEAIRIGINQPGGPAAEGADVGTAGTGVVTMALSGGTRVPTAEKAEEALPVATCEPLVIA